MNWSLEHWVVLVQGYLGHVLHGDIPSSKRRLCDKWEVLTSTVEGIRTRRFHSDVEVVRVLHSTYPSKFVPISSRWPSGWLLAGAGGT